MLNSQEYIQLHGDRILDSIQEEQKIQGERLKGLGEINLQEEACLEQ